MSPNRLVRHQETAHSVTPCLTVQIYTLYSADMRNISSAKRCASDLRRSPKSTSRWSLRRWRWRRSRARRGSRDRWRRRRAAAGDRSSDRYATAPRRRRRRRRPTSRTGTSALARYSVARNGLWLSHERNITAGHRTNARNNARCTQGKEDHARPGWTASTCGQKESIGMTKTKWRKYCTSMVWPTLR